MQIKNLTDMFRPMESSESHSQKIKGSAASRDTSTAKGDRVSLSQTAQLYKATRQAAQDSPEIRAEKVGQIKSQVASGTYEMNSRKTAEKMLEQESALWNENT